MTNKPATQRQLLAENEDLRDRLAQAEAILREMRSGEVDALVIPEMGGAQLFTLKDVGQSFRILVEEMSEGAWTMTAEGVVVYANRRFAGMLKTPLEKVIGSTVRTWIAPDSQPILQSLLEKGAGEERREELSLAASDGTMVPVYLSVSNLPIEGRPDAYCLVAFDLTEHNRIEAIAASESEARELLVAANQSRGELLRVIEDKTRAEKHLVQTEARYRGLLEAAPDAMVVVNQGGEIVLLNVQAEKQFGYRRDELVGQKVKNIIPDGFAERLVADGLRSTAKALAQQIGTGIELTGRRKDGSDFPIEIMLSPLESAEGILVTAAIRDISARKATEKKIGRLNQVYAVLSGINTLIVHTRDRQDLFDEACRIMVEQGQFRLARIGILNANGSDITLVSRAGADEGYLDNIQFTARDGAPDRCEMLTRALREKAVVICNDIGIDPQMARGREEALRCGYRSMVVFPLQFADKVLGVLLLNSSETDFFDAEEMKLLTEMAGNISFAIDHIEKQARLDYLAYYDELTGLANRNLFFERLAQYRHRAVSGGHKLAVFLIDLERFKNINDSLGLPAGDALLRQVAGWLTRRVGDAGLLARVGTDVFAAVLPEVRQDGDLERFLEKKMDAFVEHSFRLNDAVFRVAVKIGGALFPEDGAAAETLFRNAEVALKKAKASGQRYLFYTQTMSEAIAGKLSLENQLRHAIDNEEFVLHYQPKVNASGKLTSAEALIRWNDPRTGLVPPGRFIPILEETGMIYEVGRWAVRKAIADYLRWRVAGLAAVRIAVNVSALQLRNRGFIEEIRQAIGIDAQAPAGLELEITESLIMEDVKGTIASLQAIRAMGVSIAIDDFGTGFSSLSYLAKLPVDTLKIDRSFVIDMTAGPEGLGLVSTIISLAHVLKLKVVAEGVETEEQSRLLRLLACDEMQGFLFSKPVPAEIFETKFLAPPPAG